jgi:hypothetical protein
MHKGESKSEDDKGESHNRGRLRFNELFFSNSLARLWLGYGSSGDELETRRSCDSLASAGDSCKRQQEACQTGDEEQRRNPWSHKILNDPFFPTLGCAQLRKRRRAYLWEEEAYPNLP